MSVPAVDWVPLLPLLSVTATAVGVLVVDLFLEGSDRDVLAWLSVLGLAATAIVAAVLWGHQPAKTLCSRRPE
jgi:NADH:ubiquinone oxidoreductase subunit 2 (subunit N)